METSATATPSLFRRAATFDWREHQLWLVPAAFAFVWLSVFAFILPYDFDESVYTIVATGITEGRWPYRDLFDNKPPLIYVWYLPAAFTGHVEVQRILGVFMAATSIGIFAHTARSWLQGRQVALAIWAYALLLANPYMFVGASIETFMLIPVLAAVAVPSALLAGVLLGIAVMTKPIALFFLPILFVRWKWGAWRSALGIGLVCLVVLLSFAPVFPELWDANVSFNREFTAFGFSEYGLGQRLWQLVGLDFVLVMATLPLWLAAIAGLFRAGRGSVLLWAICGFLVLKANGYTTGSEGRHYHTLLVPAVALLAGIGFDYTLNRVSFRAFYFTAAAFSVGLLVAAVTRVFVITPESESLIGAIQKTSGEFYQLGASPNLYTQTNRQPERRFFFNLPLVVRPEWGETTRLELSACPPDVLVVKVQTEANRDTFDIPWTSELDSLYASRRQFGDSALLTDPIRPCDR